MTAPKPTVGEVLSHVSGLPESTVKSIFEEVKANSKKLESCARHDFQPIRETMVGALVRDYRCSVCGGEARSTDVHWYELGLKHAKGGAK